MTSSPQTTSGATSSAQLGILFLISNLHYHIRVVCSCIALLGTSDVLHNVSTQSPDYDAAESPRRKRCKIIDDGPNDHVMNPSPGAYAKLLPYSINEKHVPCL